MTHKFKGIYKVFTVLLVIYKIVDEFVKPKTALEGLAFRNYFSFFIDRFEKGSELTSFPIQCPFQSHKLRRMEERRGMFGSGS